MLSLSVNNPDIFWSLLSTKTGLVGFFTFNGGLFGNIINNVGFMLRCCSIFFWGCKII